jgi:arylsulfatase A-like enzyme
VPFRTAWLVDHFTWFLSDLVKVVGPIFGEVPYRILSHLSPYLMGYLKKDGASINRDFLDWLSHRPQPARPFFAFLNYFDAHNPYLLPTGARYRFGMKPLKPADFVFLGTYWDLVDKLTLRPVYRTLGRDSYDNCVAYLDERLGDLIDELQRRGVLDHTLLIVTSDHGEGMGEHGLYEHGESLYAPEIHVPLVIVLPAGMRETGVVREPVSLRDLPATILDLVGLNDGSPFLGRSMVNLWRNRSSGDSPVSTEIVISELLEPNPTDPNRGRSPARRGPLISLAEGDWVYIRNKADGSEELYNVREDPDELRNLSRVEAIEPVIERLRHRLNSLK